MADLSLNDLARTGDRLTTTSIKLSGNQANKLLAMVIPHFNNIFYHQVALGAEKKARENGYVLLVASTEEDRFQELEIINQMMVHQVAGYIIAPVEQSRSTGIELIRRVNAPLVVIERMVKDNVHHVGINHFQLFYECTEYLIKQGHRKIALVTWNIEPSHISMRETAFLKAIEDHGIPPDQILVKKCERNPDAGHRVIDEILTERPDITAIMVSLIEIGEGIVSGLREKGIKIPDQMSVFIYGQTKDWVRYNNPKFTCAYFPCQLVGEKAVELVLGQIAGTAPPPQCWEVEGKIELGQSVKNLLTEIRDV